MNKDQAKKLYEYAHEFLVEKLKKELGVSRHEADRLLRDMISPKRSDLTPKDMPALWKRLLKSVVNANMKSNVVGSHLDKIKEILCGYDPSEFQKKWGKSWQKEKANEFLDEVTEKLGKGQKIRRTPRSLWPQFYKSSISSASFLGKFENMARFMEWAKYMADSRDSNPALPLVLAAEIHGFGYALACDFLKEIGFLSYGKPDVHVKYIFKAAGLISDGTSDYWVQNAIRSFAEDVKAEPYSLDKVFWLIGSGKFGKRSEGDSEYNIGNNKVEFCNRLKEKGWTNLG